MKRTGRQWGTCQFWCSLVNANPAARCWAVSTGPTTGHRAFMPPSWTLDNLVQNIYTVGGHSVGLWKCSSCSSLHRADISSTDELLPYGPVQLSRLCWETHQTSLRQHVWMRLPGPAGLTVQTDWVVGTASCYRQ